MEVFLLYQENFPSLPRISQGTIDKIENQSLGLGHGRKIKKIAAHAMSDETKLLRNDQY